MPIIQSLAQLEKNYGKEGSAIIIDNCQIAIYGGFAPNSEAAEVLSKTLGDEQSGFIFTELFRIQLCFKTQKLFDF